MKVGLLKNFLHFFNLKQGTVLIAIFQLFTSGFSMIFFVLALAHAMGIQEMVVRDTEDALEREALEDISSNHLNTKKMELAHHNATGHYKFHIVTKSTRFENLEIIQTQDGQFSITHTMNLEEVSCKIAKSPYFFTETFYSMYCGLLITIIHFISTILLLYGALTNNRHFMAPWMMVMTTIISALTISLFLVEQDCPFLATLGGKADICERLVVFFLVITSSYVWFVVYSTYKSLETKKGLTHTVHGVKKKQPPPVVQTAKVVQTYANKPFEV